MANRLTEVKAGARRRLPRDNTGNPTARRLRPGMTECMMVIRDIQGLRHPVAVILMERALTKAELLRGSSRIWPMQ